MMCRRNMRIPRHRSRTYISRSILTFHTGVTFWTHTRGIVLRVGGRCDQRQPHHCHQEERLHTALLCLVSASFGINSLKCIHTLLVLQNLWDGLVFPGSSTRRQAPCEHVMTVTDTSGLPSPRSGGDLQAHRWQS